MDVSVIKRKENTCQNKLGTCQNEKDACLIPDDMPVNHPCAMKNKQIFLLSRIFGLEGGMGKISVKGGHFYGAQKDGEIIKIRRACGKRHGQAQCAALESDSGIF